MKMGVLSDTHIPLRAKALPPQVFEIFADTDLIVHCGDINTLEVLEELSVLSPVRAVYGNTDPYEVAVKLSTTQIFTFGFVKVGVYHGHGFGNPLMTAKRHLAGSGCRLVLFGHSHCPQKVCEDDGTIYFNPGSVATPRCTDRGTVGIVEVDEKEGIRARIIEL